MGAVVEQAERELARARKEAQAARDAIVNGADVSGAELAAADIEVERAALLVENARRIEAEQAAEARTRVVDALLARIDDALGGDTTGSYADVDRCRMDLKAAVARLYAAVEEHDAVVVDLVQTAESIAGEARERGLSWQGAGSRNGGQLSPQPSTMIRSSGRAALRALDADSAVAAAVLDGLATARVGKTDAGPLEPALHNQAKRYRRVMEVVGR